MPILPHRGQHWAKVWCVPPPWKKECSVLQIIKFALTRSDSYFMIIGWIKSSPHSGRWWKSHLLASHDKRKWNRSRDGVRIDCACTPWIINCKVRWLQQRNGCSYYYQLYPCVCMDYGSIAILPTFGQNFTQWCPGLRRWKSEQLWGQPTCENCEQWL